MVHARGRIRLRPEWDGRYSDVSSGAAARDAFEQAEGVDASRDPTTGHDPDQPLGDERARGDTVRAGQGEVGAAWAVVAVPACLGQRRVQFRAELRERVGARGD